MAARRRRGSAGVDMGLEPSARPETSAKRRKSIGERQALRWVSSGEFGKLVVPARRLIIILKTRQRFHLSHVNSHGVTLENRRI